MFKRKENAFTLIELIAVLVIMAIIALIVTPLVMSIIRKARISADKRSIDAYGRSIELAIAGYLLDTGSFPTDINQLTIEYSGDEVVCSTTQLNSDSSVYLAGCTVAGRNVEGYTYGEDKTPQAPSYDEYSVGDTVTYNNINYYVITDSSSSEQSVTLLKAEPLSYEEVQTYSAVTGAQTINRNGYGGMQYGTTSTYSTSYVKATVDNWKAAEAPSSTEARLIQYDEFENLGYVEENINPSDIGWVKSENTPTWVYNSNYWYWTMTPVNDSTNNAWVMNNVGNFQEDLVSNGNAGGVYIGGIVRPVIVLPKSALS